MEIRVEVRVEMATTLTKKTFKGSKYKAERKWMKQWVTRNTQGLDEPQRGPKLLAIKDRPIEDEPQPKKSPTETPTQYIRQRVWDGEVDCTEGGLERDDLELRPNGRLVSKRASMVAKQRAAKKDSWPWALKYGSKIAALHGVKGPYKKGEDRYWIVRQLAAGLYKNEVETAECF